MGDIKMGPCGADPKPTTPVPAANTFKAGATIPVAWIEVIGHPGWFRLALDEDGQDGFVDPTLVDYNKFIANPKDPSLNPLPTTRQVAGAWILSDYLINHTAAAANTPRSTMVTLPNVTCARCTLQLIQVMADTLHPYPNSRYYHCADIAITTGTGGTGGTTPDAGVPDASGGGAGSGGGAAGAGGSTGAGGAATTGAGGTGGATTGSGGTGGVATTTGSGGTATTGTGGTTTTGAGGSKSSGGGCSIAGGRSNVGWGILALFGLVRLARRRGRR